MTSTPWAILLCKYSDNSSEPYPRNRFEEIFTNAGSGKFNMVDFYRDMSHGKLDLTGSRIFPDAAKGWYTMTQKTTDVRANRADIIQWGLDAAAANGDSLSGFFNKLIVTNVPTDCFGSTGGVATDDGRWPDTGVSSLSPCIMGQEMGHGYNLNHSRVEGSDADYQDPYDIMSTETSTMAPHPVYTERDVRGNPIFRIGPGMNAANMSAMGWLDTTRTWIADPHELFSTVQLRPLHRRDLPGYLCAQYNDTFIEFRMKDRWDAGLTSPVVLLHTYFDGHSYLSTGGVLGAGDSYSKGDTSDTPSGILHGAGLKITVTDINVETQTATLEIRTWKGIDLQAGPAQTFFGGVTRGGGGWVFVNGKLTWIPPHSPLRAILEQVVSVQESEAVRHGLARQLVQQQAYNTISSIGSEQANKSAALRSPSLLGGRNSR